MHEYVSKAFRAWTRYPQTYRDRMEKAILEKDEEGMKYHKEQLVLYILLEGTIYSIILNLIAQGSVNPLTCCFLTGLIRGGQYLLMD